MKLEDSLIMGDDLSTIPKKEPEKFIKSSVEDLVPIPSESEDTSDSDKECDLPFCDNSVTFSNPLFDANDDECFNLGGDIDEITNIHSDYSLPDYDAFYFDDDHIEEKSSGSTTTHSDFSLPEYDLFIFDLSIDSFPPADRSVSHHEEFADELAHIISQPKNGNLSMGDFLHGRRNPINTLGDYSRLSYKGYGNNIELPDRNNEVPLQSNTIRLVQNGCSLHKLRSEDLNQYLKDFLKLVDSLDFDVANKERTRSIFTWEDNTTRFLAQFFPPERTAKLRNDILMFQQHQASCKNAEESWALLEDLALYDNENWNDPRDFGKPVKAISLPQDVLGTSNRRLTELENQVQRLMEAHFAPKSSVQMNKITFSWEICRGPHDTQYFMENPDQVFVDYASLRTDEAGGKWKQLEPREDPEGIRGISNFTGRIKEMHIFLGKFTYVLDFMIVKDISSIIDHRLPQVVLGKPFVKISNMTHDLSLGVVKFTDGTNEITYKMPYKIEQYNSLSNLEKEHTKSVYLGNEEDKRRGVEYVISKILGFYKEFLELGPEYLTGLDDKGGVT
ncbi:MAK10-like protein [Tanacetum coccineum]